MTEAILIVLYVVIALSFGVAVHIDRRDWVLTIIFAFMWPIFLPVVAATR